MGGLLAFGELNDALNGASDSVAGFTGAVMFNIICGYDTNDEERRSADESKIEYCLFVS
jgi:hypothetical protein